MRRAIFFALLLGLGILLLVLVMVWYLVAYQSGSAPISSMMGQMMGRQYSATTVAPMPLYVWLGIVSLFVLVATGVGGLAYYVTYPQIPSRVPTTSEPKSVPEALGVQKPSTQNVSWSTVLRTSKPDERKVLEILSAHGGKQLQKLIVKESGLSKLRIHRIIARFAQRGIVSVTKSGNTNEVSLSAWLNQSSASAKNGGK